MTYLMSIKIKIKTCRGRKISVINDSFNKFPNMTPVQLNNSLTIYLDCKNQTSWTILLG